MPVKSTEPIGPCEVSLDIEVESIKVAEAVDKAYREFSKYVAVPGFRRGKAPMAFVKQRVPQDQLRERTVEILTGPAFEAAISESKIVPYTRPRMELVKLETAPPDYVFEFKAIVPLAPAITLGKYIGLEMDRERETVTDAGIDERIEAMRARATQYPPIEDRAAKMGDVIEGELLVEFDDVESSGQFEPIAITLGDKANLVGIDEALVGIAKAEERSFDIDYPADFPSAEQAGKRAHATVRVKNLYERVVPELDDDFAKQCAAESMDALRANTRSEMEKRSLAVAESVLESKLIDAIVESSTIDYPPVLAEVELETDLRAFMDNLGRREISLEDYLERSGQAQDELIAEFKGRIDARLKRGLALGEIARAEGIEIGDEDVDAEIKDRADAQHTSVQAVRAYIDRAGGMQDLRDKAYVKKIVGFVKAAATITDKVVATPGAEVAVEAPKTKKPRKKKEAAVETPSPETAG